MLGELSNTEGHQEVTLYHLQAHPPAFGATLCPKCHPRRQVQFLTTSTILQKSVLHNLNFIYFLSIAFEELVVLPLETFGSPTPHKVYPFTFLSSHRM